MDSNFDGNELSKENLEAAIGIVRKYEDNGDTILPRGDTGSLQWQLVDSNELDSLCNYSIVFTGSLEDVFGPEEVFDWLNEYVTTENIKSYTSAWIQDAVFRVETKGRGSWICTWNDGWTIIDEKCLNTEAIVTHAYLTDK